MRESDLWPELKQYWHPVAFSEDVSDRPLAIGLLDERLVFCRLGGQVRAFRDLCIHRGTPLSLGWVEGEMIVCAYHGWTYQGDGKCVKIPSLPPDHPIPKKACLTAYPAQERYGLIWVCMADEPRAPIPHFPALEDPSYRIVVRDKRIWQCSAARQTENFVDVAHFPWVHDGILGDRNQPLAPEVVVERNGEEILYWYINPPDYAHPVAYRRSCRIIRPFAIYQWKEESGGKIGDVVVSISTPNSAKESIRFLLLARNTDAPPLSGEVGSGESRSNINDIIAEQDRVIVENQRPEELPLDLTEELHVKGPDGVALAYRKMMRELGVE